MRAHRESPGAEYLAKRWGGSALRQHFAQQRMPNGVWRTVVRQGHAAAFCPDQCLRLLTKWRGGRADFGGRPVGPGGVRFCWGNRFFDLIKGLRCRGWPYRMNVLSSGCRCLSRCVRCALQR